MNDYTRAVLEACIAILENLEEAERTAVIDKLLETYPQ